MLCIFHILLLNEIWKNTYWNLSKISIGKIFSLLTISRFRKRFKILGDFVKNIRRYFVKYFHYLLFY